MHINKKTLEYIHVRYQLEKRNLNIIKISNKIE